MQGREGVLERGSGGGEGRQTGEREGRGNELMCESIIIEIIWNNTIILLKIQQLLTASEMMK